MKKNLTRSVIIAIMKLSIIPALLLFCVCFSFARTTKSQELLNKKITIKVRSEEIQTILSEIEKLSGGKFMYSPEIIHSSRKVSLNAKNEKLSDILTRLLQPLGIRYEVMNNYIILNRENDIVGILYTGVRADHACFLLFHAGEIIWRCAPRFKGNHIIEQPRSCANTYRGSI